MTQQFSCIEMFAGGGMARLGLGDSWRTVLANDFDPQKCTAYRENFGGGDLLEGDIADLPINCFPTERADLIWGSFPCQDLSLAGARGGINAKRSGSFFAFWRHVQTLKRAGKAPRIIALENVTGLLTSNGGEDFRGILNLLARAKYRVSAQIIDASIFTPQSRPRLFIIGICNDVGISETGLNTAPADTPSQILTALTDPSPALKRQWFWIQAPQPIRRNSRFSDIVEKDAEQWHSPSQTNTLLAMMSPKQRARIDAIIASKATRYGAGFRRVRMENGEKTQRFEARFDGLAGCLRTPAGGSSRQIVVAIQSGILRTRLMTPREAARLMGLPDEYLLPKSNTAALKLCGDGVSVPVVRWLAENVFEPALRGEQKNAAAA